MSGMSGDDCRMSLDHFGRHSLSFGWFASHSSVDNPMRSKKRTINTVGFKKTVIIIKLIMGTGSLVRVGPNEVITNDPEVLRRVMAVRSTYTRGHCKNYISQIRKIAH